MTIAVEEDRIRRLLERVEVVEDVANSLDEDDERRGRLLDVSHAVLAEEGEIRPAIAAKLLGLSERTVRTWAAAGVLGVVSRSPRLKLDLVSVHAVVHLVQELRAAGRDRDLLDAVWHRLTDQATLDRDDLRESMEQMRQGEGRVLRPKPR
jgi:hypothetical protein